jgi:hypothetical protein
VAAKRSPTREECYARWLLFEDKYARALASFQQQAGPERATREVAVDLAGLRAKADLWRDAFFRKALT